MKLIKHFRTELKMSDQSMASCATGRAITSGSATPRTEATLSSTSASLASTRLDHLDSWVSNNGLRVEKRSSDDFWINLNEEEMDPSLRVVEKAPSAFVTKVEMNDVDETGAAEGWKGPWYELQIRKGENDTWMTIYKGYRKRVRVGELIPNTTYYFRKRRNGDDEWGTTIYAATDCLPPNAHDIHKAVHCGSENLILRIIASSPQPRLRKLLESVDSMGMTPLMLACQCSHINIAGMLVKAGAHPHTVSPISGKTAAMYAACSGNIQLMDFFHTFGVDWQITDNSGNTALQHAVTADKMDAVRFIMDITDNERRLVEIREPNNGWTLLLRAIMTDASRGMCELLLNVGSDPNVFDTDRKTSCLMAAVIKGRKDLVKLLLQHGAEQNEKNSLGKTARTICVDKEIAKMLKEFRSNSPSPGPAPHPQPQHNRRNPNTSIANMLADAFRVAHRAFRRQGDANNMA